MPSLTFFGWVFSAWSLVATVLAGLLIYRSTVSMKESDQIFLDPAEAGLEAHQQEIQARLRALDPYVRVTAATVAGLLSVMVGFVMVRVLVAL